jgi:LDH2 family malate/lactate/ureidoglycolate dehydrogenase
LLAAIRWFTALSSLLARMPVVIRLSRDEDHVCEPIATRAERLPSRGTSAGLGIPQLDSRPCLVYVADPTGASVAAEIDTGLFEASPRWKLRCRRPEVARLPDVDMVEVERTAALDATQRALGALGAQADDALYVATLLLRAHLGGYSAHGLNRIPSYARAVGAGTMDMKAKPDVRSIAPGVALIDGNRGLGQPIARLATELAVERAKTLGVGIAVVRRCSDVARLADYAELAAELGAIGIFCAASTGPSVSVAPFGGSEPRLGTNPIAFGIPREQPPHLVADFSTSAASNGRVAAARRAGKPPPAEWAADLGAGEVLLPAAGFRGFALGLLVSVLASVLSGAGAPGLGDEVETSFFALAVDLATFDRAGSSPGLIEELLDFVKSSPAAHGSSGVRLPGERGWRAAGSLEAHVRVERGIWSDVLALAARDVPDKN